MSSAATWHIEHGRGLLRSVDCTAVVEVRHLTLGLFDIQRSGRELAGAHLLGVQVPGFPDPLPAPWVVDQYVRRNDLIATYEHPEPDHLRVQVYWRHVWEEASAETDPAGRVAGIHLIVSLQTNRLDLRPTLTVFSDMATDQALCLIAPDEPQWTPVVLSGEGGDPAAVAQTAHAALWLVRPPDIDQSIVMMTLPSDLVSTVLAPHASQWRYGFELLDEHLEKGVIRRAQVAAWFVPRATDESWGRKLFLQLLSAPPPLTT